MAPSEELHFPPPKNPQWEFNHPNSHLVKIPIDLRQYRPAPTYGLFPERTLMPRDPQQPGGQASSVPANQRKENVKPTQGEEKIEYFGAKAGFKPDDGFFGGPILNTTTFTWRPTFFTKANGNVPGAQQAQFPIPLNMNRVIRSVGCMSSPKRIQSGLWVGPRLFLATLHMEEWSAEHPTKPELELAMNRRLPYHVETEISTKLRSEHSPIVDLVGFEMNWDLGIFKLADGCPSQQEWIDPDWILERDAIESLGSGLPVGCVGYSGEVSDDAFKAIHEQAQKRIGIVLGQAAPKAVPIDLHVTLKPGMKTIAPGTLDRAEKGQDNTRLGVNCSVWKGASGEPCVLLDGLHGGGIVGLVQGHMQLSDPFNVVMAFPNGLKECIKAQS